MIYGYVRISPGERKSARGDGNVYAFGVEAQRDIIIRWAADQQQEVTGWFQDIDVSGGWELDKRPALLAAIDVLGKHDVLVAAKRERLARDVVNDAMITRLVERRGAELISADGQGNGRDPANEAMRGMLAVFAQFERAILRQRVRAALAVKRRRGEWLGAAPTGWRIVDHHLEPDPIGQAVLAKIQDMRNQHLSFRQIAHELENQHVPSRRGGCWQASSVRSILLAASRQEI